MQAFGGKQEARRRRADTSSHLSLGPWELLEAPGTGRDGGRGVGLAFTSLS